MGTVEVLDAQGQKVVYRGEAYLARGASGFTCLSTGPAGERVVLKIAQALGASHERRVLNEAAAYAAINGTPELPRFYGLGVDERGHPSIVIDYVPGGWLRSTEATRKHPSLAVRIVCQVLKAVAALNDRGRSHRDLAPPNILIQGDAPQTLRVLDLGMAVSFNEPYEYGGDKYYAPEQTAALPSEGRINGDVYSAGAHLLELLTGIEPTPENQVRALAAVPGRAATRNGRKVTLRRITQCALMADPGKRLQSAREMLHLLEPFESQD